MHFETCRYIVGRLVFCLWLCSMPTPAAAEPVRLIFDTDMGNDVDDAMALSMIHALQNRGECELLAVTVTKDNPYAAPFVDLMNTFYGRGGIPIGVVRKGVTPEDGKYNRAVVTATASGGGQRYPHDLKSGKDAPDAVAVLRKTLAAQPDNSVVIAMVGFSTNMARLLASGPDAVSPLPGTELVRRKVRLLSAMAGGYTEDLTKKRYKEYNIVRDIRSAQKVFAEWPAPIVASGWEIGNAILHPAVSMREDYGYAGHHPLVEAYQYYRGLSNDQPTYDLTSVLYAVRPNRDYFALSGPGRIIVEPDGFTRFESASGGQHRYLRVGNDQIIRVREAQALLCSEPPRTLKLKQ